MNIRYQVDAYDDQCLFNDEDSGPNTNEPTIRSHIRLGSLDKIIHLGSYTKKLRKDIDLEDLQKLLTTFFRLNRLSDTGPNVLPDCEVHPTHTLPAECLHLLRWFPVMHYKLHMTARRRQ